MESPAHSGQHFEAGQRVAPLPGRSPGDAGDPEIDMATTTSAPWRDTDARARTAGCVAFRVEER